jgi:hypothetical protein
MFFISPPFRHPINFSRQTTPEIGTAHINTI